jgi:hypothetical protein
LSASSITLDTGRLRRGLFVAALDRPWEGTGFLFQGFLVETEQELSALRDNCAWVVVDLTRSLPDARRGLPVPAVGAAEDPARNRRARRSAAVEDAGRRAAAGSVAAIRPRVARGALEAVAAAAEADLEEGHGTARRGTAARSAAGRAVTAAAASPAASTPRCAARTRAAAGSP